MKEYNMKKVFISSPLRQGNVNKNIENAKNFARIATLEGYIPIVPHLYFTTFLNDDSPEEREKGMDMGINMLDDCEELWVCNYTPKSEGMAKEIDYWIENVRGTIRFL